jgi:hypothetical protein
VINAVYPDPNVGNYNPFFEVACFYNLSLLYNCRADLSFETEFLTGYGGFMPIVFSFYECDYLNYCSGSSLVAGALAPYSYAYAGCNNVSNCNASSHCTTDVFFECYVDDGKTVVEDGLNGNSTFNPA